MPVAELCNDNGGGRSGEGYHTEEVGEEAGETARKSEAMFDESEQQAHDNNQRHTNPGRDGALDIGTIILAILST